MSHSLVLGILLLSPVVGFLINGFRWKSHEGILAGTIGTLAAAISFVCTVILYMSLLDMEHDQREILVSYYKWLEIGSLNLNVSFLIIERNSHIFFFGIVCEFVCATIILPH